MPVHKDFGGYKWGNTGKVYPAKAQAEAQGRAIYASGIKKNQPTRRNKTPPKPHLKPS